MHMLDRLNGDFFLLCWCSDVEEIEKTEDDAVVKRWRHHKELYVVIHYLQPVRISLSLSES